jgi:hypothetical protein
VNLFDHPYLNKHHYFGIRFRGLFGIAQQCYNQMLPFTLSGNLDGVIVMVMVMVEPSALLKRINQVSVLSPLAFVDLAFSNCNSLW